MIYDSMDKLTQYKGLSRNLDAAIDYLGTHDVSTLPEGKHPVDGDRVIVQVMSYETKDLSAAKFEAHRRYMDIQFVLEGKEGCYMTPLAGLEPSGPFDGEKDLGFFHGEGGAFFPLTPGVFALFFPHDAHKPSCDLDGKRRNRKVVVKVAV